MRDRGRQLGNRSESTQPMPVAATQFDLFAAILLMGIGQGIFLALAILAAPKKPNNSNMLLAFLVLIFALELADKFAFASGYIFYWPQSSSLNWALDFFIGPVIYLYTQSIVRPPEKRNIWVGGVHFVLPALVLLIAVCLWIPYSAEDFLQEYYGTSHLHLDVAETLLTLASLVSLAFYLLLSFRRLKEHRKRIADNFSYTEKINLKWLWQILVALISLFMVYLGLIILSLSFFDFDKLLPLTIVLVVFLMGFLGLRQPKIFADTAPGVDYVIEEPSPETEVDNSKRYEKSALSDANSEVIYKQLCDLVEQEQLFRESKLSLPDLAVKMDLPSHYISQAINQCSGSNFFDFINTRRIDFVTHALSSPQGSGTILDIALDAGFNSKSAFYSAFKTATGLTPRQYQQQNYPAQ